MCNTLCYNNNKSPINFEGGNDYEEAWTAFRLPIVCILCRIDACHLRMGGMCYTK